MFSFASLSVSGPQGASIAPKHCGVRVSPSLTLLGPSLTLPHPPRSWRAGPHGPWNSRPAVRMCAACALITQIAEIDQTCRALRTFLLRSSEKRLVVPAAVSVRVFLHFQGSSVQLQSSSGADPGGRGLCAVRVIPDNKKLFSTNFPSLLNPAFFLFQTRRDHIWRTDVVPQL